MQLDSYKTPPHSGKPSTNNCISRNSPRLHQMSLIGHPPTWPDTLYFPAKTTEPTSQTWTRKRVSSFFIFTERHKTTLTNQNSTGDFQSCNSTFTSNHHHDKRCSPNSNSSITHDPYSEQSLRRSAITTKQSRASNIYPATEFK